VIPVTDARLRLLLLAELVRNPAGLTSEQATELRGLSAAELVRLAAMPEPRMTVAVDGAIAIGLQRTHALQTQADDREYLLRNGASSPVMLKLFAMTGPALTAERRRLGIALHLRRPPLPTGKELRLREKMQAWWWQRAKGKGTPADWVAFHKAFPGWSVASLWAVVCEATPDLVVQKRKRVRGRAQLRLVAG
jgi:hypothetical protein